MADGASIPRTNLEFATAARKAFWRKHESSAARVLDRMRADNLRERVAQDNAMDAPFNAILRERFSSRLDQASGCGQAVTSGASDGLAAAVSAGLEPSKTKLSAQREVIEVDVYGSRIKRMKKAVLNSSCRLDNDVDDDPTWQRWRRLFVTLTYRDVGEWKPAHIRQFSNCVAMWFRNRAQRTRFRMVWVLELQKRGAVHYHCILWVRSKDRFPHPDKAGWWPHGHTNLIGMKFAIKSAVGYMAKYASKGGVEQAMRVPKGARMHGVCGLNVDGRRFVRWWRSPLFVRDALGGGADIRKVQGGYVNKLTGEFCKSPWKVFVTPSGRVYAWREIPPITGEQP